MNAKRKNFAGLPSGRSWTDVTLKRGMAAEFANTEILLVHDVEATAWYEWSRGHPGSRDEPPEDEVFEIVTLRIKRMATWVDDKGNYYCKTFGKTDVLPMFSEETLQELDNTVKMMLGKEAFDNFNEPEHYMHRRYTKNRK